jgi:Uncharacterized conserved protein
MSELQLYRRRLIPAECILLKDDIIVKQTKDLIITSWKTLNPKIAFSHGCSCYFLREGFKISKFYTQNNSLLYWYCDIVEYARDESAHTLTTTDLLADVIVYPDGRTKVVDLDELAQAFETGLLTAAQLSAALRQLNHLLTYIYKDKFDQLQAPIENLGL